MDNWRSREERRKVARQDPATRHRWIVQDSRKSDRKHGFKNDLTLEFVSSLIKHGCSYCGETELKMTLDRVDNSIGHLQSNVVPACIRCNFMRRDMPYAAWYELMPTLREIRQKGLFGDWTGRAR
jgi:hypothetical protein